MRGHDEDVYGVVWSPTTSVTIGETEHSEYLLASSSRDKTVRVWSSKGGRQEHCLRIQDGGRGQRGGGGAPSFITLLWASSSQILSSGGQGELLVWDLAKSNKRSGCDAREKTRPITRGQIVPPPADSGCGGRAVSGGRLRGLRHDLDTEHLLINTLCTLSNI